MSDNKGLQKTSANEKREENDLKKVSGSHVSSQKGLDQKG